MTLACAATLFVGTARATVVSIPWALDFSFRSAAETRPVSSVPGSGTINLEGFSTNYQATARIDADAKFIFSLASVHVTAGFGFPAAADDSYHVYLPFNATFTAPDHALAGQNVFVQSALSFSSAPTFSASGKLTYGTDLLFHGSASLGPFDSKFNLDTSLPNITSNGSGLILNGSGTYTDSDRGAEQVAAGPFARSTLGDGLALANSTEKFAGNQLVTSGSVDAQRGSFNILSALSDIPVIGSVAAGLDAVSDLDLQAGVTLEEKSVFSTGAVYALFSENGGQGQRRATVLNSLGQQGFSVPVPTNATGNYSIDLYGLGLGFGLERQLLLQPELQLVFDPILFGSWTIFEKEFADALLLGRQQSRFQYEEIFSDPRSARYIPQPGRLLRFALDAPAPAAPPNVDPGLPTGLSDAGAGLYGTINLPGTALTDVAAVYTDVPEPSSWALMLLGLGLALKLRDRLWILHATGRKSRTPG